MVQPAASGDYSPNTFNYNFNPFKGQPRTTFQQDGNKFDIELFKGRASYNTNTAAGDFKTTINTDLDLKTSLTQNLSPGQNVYEFLNTNVGTGQINMGFGYENRKLGLNTEVFYNSKPQSYAMNDFDARNMTLGLRAVWKPGWL